METIKSNSVFQFGEIKVHGVRTHNLRNLDLVIPRNALTVITGPSGSGKSSLAFDTLYAEGQRRYFESLSVYSRQFLEKLNKPEVDSIIGLSPTISIDQKTTSYNPRSTVGTVTELYDYLRLLYSKISEAHCWKCGQPIQAQTIQEIYNFISSHPDGTQLTLLAPIVQDRKGEYQKELELLRERGFVRVKVNGKIFELSDSISLEKNKKNNISVFIDRIALNDLEKNSDYRLRIYHAIELALKIGNGSLLLNYDLNLQSQKQDVFISSQHSCPHCFISYPAPESKLFSFNSPYGACPECDGLGCQTCDFTRLRKESLYFTLNHKNIAELCRLSIDELFLFFTELTLSEKKLFIAKQILNEIKHRLTVLTQLGVGYLQLIRAAQTLSGGESQRLRLGAQLNSSLIDVVYILDEPSIGLHQSDHMKLIHTLLQLKDQGNTVIVIEHDRDTIEHADWILDLGPGAGTEGGQLMAEGTLNTILRSKKSLTGRYLSGKLKIPLPKKRRTWDPNKVIHIHGAYQNNLKKVHAQFPIGVFTCVTGVSGSGKSTLVLDTLYNIMQTALQSQTISFKDFQIESASGMEWVNHVIHIDQCPIGKKSSSTPANYTGVFNLIRDLFAQIPQSKARGYSKKRYSFNLKGGRCEFCEGSGVNNVKIHFLQHVSIPCSHCHGKKYNPETLEIQYKGKNISEILDLTHQEAETFFRAIPKIFKKLKLLNSAGLGYLKLGQNATTLSGGEAQRLKLCKELGKSFTGKTLYILDEPSTGLHFDDIKKLIEILQLLVDEGNTVIVIEHNLDIIKVADYQIDLGPGGGIHGGSILATGTPENIVQNKNSLTGKFLSPYL